MASAPLEGSSSSRSASSSSSSSASSGASSSGSSTGPGRRSVESPRALRVRLSPQSAEEDFDEVAHAACACAEDALQEIHGHGGTCAISRPASRIGRGLPRTAPRRSHLGTAASCRGTCSGLGRPRSVASVRGRTSLEVDSLCSAMPIFLDDEGEDDGGALLTKEQLRAALEDPDDGAGARGFCWSSSDEDEVRSAPCAERPRSVLSLRRDLRLVGAAAGSRTGTPAAGALPDAHDAALPQRPASTVVDDRRREGGRGEVWVRPPTASLQPARQSARAPVLQGAQSGGPLASHALMHMYHTSLLDRLLEEADADLDDRKRDFHALATEQRGDLETPTGLCVADFDPASGHRDGGSLAGAPGPEDVPRRTETSATHVERTSRSCADSGHCSGPHSAAAESSAILDPLEAAGVVSEPESSSPECFDLSSSPCDSAPPARANGSVPIVESREARAKVGRPGLQSPPRTVQTRSTQPSWKTEHLLLPMTRSNTIDVEVAEAIPSATRPIARAWRMNEIRNALVGMAKGGSAGGGVSGSMASTPRGRAGTARGGSAAGSGGGSVASTPRGRVVLPALEGAPTLPLLDDQAPFESQVDGRSGLLRRFPNGARRDFGPYHSNAPFPNGARLDFRSYHSAPGARTSEGGASNDMVSLS